MVIENGRCKRGHPARRSGATLVESVAVAAALVVLVTCLVPAAAQAGRDSKASRCLSHLRQIGLANTVYASEDLGDSALPVHEQQFQQDRLNPRWPTLHEWGGKSGKGRPGAVPAPDGSPDVVTSRYGTLAGFGPATRPLNPILFAQTFADYSDPSQTAGQLADTELDLGTVRCPTDSGYTGVNCHTWRDEGMTSYDHYGTSYAANLLMMSYVGGGPIWSNSPFLHRLSDIVSPATTLLYQENAGQWAWRAAEQPISCRESIGPGPVGGWHGKDWTFNTAFVDGHADSIFMRGFRRARVLPNDNDQEYLRCLIIRGERWQKDTLPLEPVITGFWWDGSSSEGCRLE